jgi:uncharacterized membrane protein (UPF0127 family)
VISLLLVACGSKLPKDTIEIGEHRLTVEVAATPESRRVGLMHRDRLPAGTGMLFVYPDEQVRGFWMKDTRIPLSIAFVTRSGRIVRIADMQPFSTSRVSSLAPATYAIEVNQGWFAERGIAAGTTVTGLPSDLPVE